MAQPPKTIFRPEAMAKYMDSQSTPVFPKLIGPRLFPKLWALIALLIAAMLFLVWMPITQTHQANGTPLLLDQTSRTMSFLLSDLNDLKVEPGDTLVWLSPSEMESDAEVLAVSPTLDDARDLHEQFPNLKPLHTSNHFPAIVVSVQAPQPSSAALSGRTLEITIQKPPKRFLDWLFIGARGS